ncbi:MAG TPA: SGNH/GDSL hydrolase family protein [Candidatus Saccharimonadales bacterium]|jgi:lysophospholipase L1-like esterase|nr:SGNH/GDSL hydrolase family protein [Candidatus Saccharimonadales bacterium]
MNTNPDAITILCYGDSNTRGSRPDNWRRYSANVRWTGILQAGLGPEYYVIEEGRGGRTTDIDHPQVPGRNGRLYLQPCLESHNPLDIIIIMLGTNDLKQMFKRTAQDIGHALESLLDDINLYAKDRNNDTPKIIIVSPVYIAKNILDTEGGERFGESAHEKSLKLAAVYKQIADNRGLIFFDAAQVASVGPDGVHIDETGHKSLGQALTKVVVSV